MCLPGFHTERTYLCLYRGRSFACPAGCASGQSVPRALQRECARPHGRVPVRPRMYCLCTACWPAGLPAWQSAGAPSPACWPARLRACSVLPPADSSGKWRGASQLQPAALGQATQHARCSAAACAWRCIAPWRRKKFELPNGTGLAVSAGLQYVGGEAVAEGVGEGGRWFCCLC